MKGLRILAIVLAVSTFQITNVHAALTLDDANFISKRCVKLLINSPEIVDGSIVNSKQDYFEWSGKDSMIAYNCLPSFTNNGELRANLNPNILAVVNKIAVDLAEEIARFEPRPKGQFEKTVDYENAISVDKLEHQKKYGNTKLNFALYAYVWDNLMGKIGIGSSPDTKPKYGLSSSYTGPDLNPIYNADKEVLSIKVMFNEYRIPASFDIKMTPTQAEKLLNAFGGIGIYAFAPTLTFYLDGYNLVIKKLSLKPYSNSFNKEEYDAIGIDLENIPTNVVIKRAVGAEISKNFEANFKKQK